MRSLFLLFALLCATCANGELPPRSAIDPANPTAQEAPPISMPSLGTEVSPTHSNPHEHSIHDASTQTLYTCPMHPEIIQKTAGLCPKCGMTLQPKD